jgi:capsular exopolysaccharide synthesis family protein
MSGAISHKSSANEEALDLKQWLYKILRIWPWFLVSLVMCLFVAFLYLRYTKPVYKAVASIMIKDDKKGGAGLMDNTMLKELGLGVTSKLVENETEVLRSYDLMNEVVMGEQLYLKLNRKGHISDRTVFGKEAPFILEVKNAQLIPEEGFQWDFSKGEKGWELKTSMQAPMTLVVMGQWYSVGDIKFQFLPNIKYAPSKTELERGNEYVIEIKSPLVVTEEYAKSLKVEPISKLASVISLSIEDLHPERATTILTTLISIYNQQGLDDKNQVTANTMDFLTDRLRAVERELKGVEGKVEEYKSQNQITNISSDAQQYLDLAKDIDKQKAEQQTQVNLINALERELVLNKDNPKLVPSTLGIAEPSMMSLINRHNELVLQLERVQQKAGPNNPLLLDLQGQVIDVRSTLIENVKNLRNAYNIGLNDIARKDAQLNSRIRSIPQLEKNLVQITRDQSVQEQLYLFLLQKREESAVTLASTINDSRTIVKSRSLGKIKPFAKIVLALAIGLGLMFPFAFIGISEFLDNKVGHRKEVEQKTIVPLLGEVSYLKKLDSPIPVLNGGRSVIAEQFRTIRTAISYTGKGLQARVILLTSHRPGEGKSFTSMNLAASYALLNQKVVILEFDLRKPRVARTFNLNPKAGISTYLSGQSEIDEIIIPIKDHTGNNFFLLPAGPLPPNPAELILGPNMKIMIEELKERFDVIIIDTPPFSVVTDATLLQKFADISIVVLRQGYTFKEVYEELNQRMQKFPEIPIYCVLNGVGKMHKYNYYGYGTYGYGNGYGYGYGYADGYYDKEDDTSKKSKAKEKAIKA